MPISEGMVKLFSPGDWENSVETSDHQIKIASGGLQAGDKLAAKKFASEELLHWLSQLKTSPDGVYVHKVAMSGSDRFGPNRWGDGFREEVLQRDVPTFEVYAKAYRNHKSDKAPFYGRPKIARLRKDLGTVELVTEYYGTEKLASENGGRVADLEIQMLAKLGSIPVSMGSHVPGDKCVVCGHWSKTREFHCTSKKEGGYCELYGCKNGMLKIAADGRQQYVDNPLNCFFDISMVTQGADPVANGLLLPIGMFESNSRKIAAFCEKLAEYVPADVKYTTAYLTPTHRSAMQLAYLWAGMEQKLAAFELDEVDVGLALTQDVQGLQTLFSVAPRVRAATIQVLAKQACCPTFTAFAKASGLADWEIKQASQYVPNVYSRIIREDLLDHVVRSINLEKNLPQYLVEIKSAGIDTTITQAAVIRRGLRGNAEGVTVTRAKTAGFELKLPSVVVDYAAFKLAWACQADLNPWTLHALAKREFSRLENTSELD